MSPKITITNPEIERYAESISWNSNNDLENVISATKDHLEFSDMISGSQVCGLLQILIKSIGAQKVVEVGMFTGYATLSMAQAMHPEGTLYALEMNEKYIRIAKSIFEQSSHNNLIQIVIGNARETVVSLPNDLDFVFLDADKEFYPQYYELLIDKLRSGGLMVIDNVLWHGSILGPNLDRKAKAIDTLNNRIRIDERVDSVLLTVRDGIHVLRKK
jgi:caffeoyl-CoA O-methyltransferase